MCGARLCNCANNCPPAFVLLVRPQRQGLQWQQLQLHPLPLQEGEGIFATATQATTVQKDHPGLLGLRVKMVTWAAMELMVKAGSQAPTSLFPKTWPINASCALEAHPARLVPLEVLEMQDQKEAMELLEELENQVELVLKDHLDLPDHLEELDSLVPRVRLVKTAPLAPKAPTVMQELMDPQVLLVAKETTANQARLGASDHLVLPDPQATRQTMAALVNLAPLVLLAHLAKMLNTALARREPDRKETANLESTKVRFQQKLATI